MKTVTIHHPGTGQQADVYERALPHHERAGWKRGPLPSTTDEPQPTGEVRRVTPAKPQPASKPAGTVS